jgi:exodeoxyribonuclease VII large subunit
MLTNSLQIAEPAEEQEGVSLSSLLARVRGVIQGGFAETLWVRSEIRTINAARSGHYYLELEERDEQGKVVAKCDGKLWANRARTLRAKFADGTGGDLRPDIKVLILVRVEFHPSFGFALTIEDIDPSYTLGDLLARLEAIRNILRSEGVFEQNRSLPLPSEFCRVAVISPSTSAGQGDFRSETDRLHDAGLCEFNHYPATFQGEETSRSIREALRISHESHQSRPYDALVIIRGGGSVTDLAWLNDLKLARWVCRLPIPVFTGIGHERDSTIIDEVAHRRFDTPSKVALHISHAIRDNAWDAIHRVEQIETQVRRIVARQVDAVETLRDRIREQVGVALTSAGREVDHRHFQVRQMAEHRRCEAETMLATARTRLDDGVATRLREAERGLEHAVESLDVRSRSLVENWRTRAESAMSEVASKAEAKITSATRDVEDARGAVEAGVGTMMSNARTHLDFNIRQVVGFGPEATLRRGYAIARDGEGRPLATKIEAEKHATLSIQFRDGSLAVENRGPRGEDGS